MSPSGLSFQGERRCLTSISRTRFSGDDPLLLLSWPLLLVEVGCAVEGFDGHRSQALPPLLGSVCYSSETHRAKTDCPRPPSLVAIRLSARRPLSARSSRPPSVEEPGEYRWFCPSHFFFRLATPSPDDGPPHFTSLFRPVEFPFLSLFFPNPAGFFLEPREAPVPAA